jgi:hypothetical protein
VVIAVALCGVGVSCVALTAAASSEGASRRPRVVWADAAHKVGWIADSPQQGRFRCTPKAVRKDLKYRGRRYSVAVLCRTSDGGRSWTPSLYGGSAIYAVACLNTRACGVMTGGYRIPSAAPHTPEFWWSAVWTLDGGKHWFVDFLNPKPPPDSGPGTDPWGSCGDGDWCVPTLRVARLDGVRRLLSRASDGHTYAIRGLGARQGKVIKCKRGPVAYFLQGKVGPRNICVEPDARLWLQLVK